MRKTAFLFTRVGLAGCDMGACAMLPRIIGQGRASELLFTGRSMSGQEAFNWGFFNKLSEPDEVFFHQDIRIVISVTSFKTSDILSIMAVNKLYRLTAVV